MIEKEKLKHFDSHTLPASVRTEIQNRELICTKNYKRTVIVR